MLPVVPADATPFNYKMDPERLIRETDGAKYAGADFPAAASDTGVYFLTATNTYANSSNVLQAINKSSCDATLTVKVKTTASGGGKDIALAESSAVATEGTPNLYLGLKVGNTTTVVSGTEQTVTKTIAGVPGNFETAVVDNAYTYREKANATSWKAINISMEGKVSNLAIASDTTAPTVNVTWSYAKAADGAAVATDVVEYSTTPPTTMAVVYCYPDSSNVALRMVAGASMVEAKLTSVKVDGTEVDSSKYSIADSGALIIEDLTAGDRTFTVVYDGITYTGSGTVN